MKKLITILYVTCVILVSSQVILTDKPTNTTENRPIEITKALEQASKAIEEVKSIKAQNEQDLEEVNKIDMKTKKVIDEISSITTKLSKRKIINKTRIIEIIKQNEDTTLDLSSIPLDSTCIELKRHSAFSKKKCSKWEYFKIVNNNKQEKLIIKVE